MLLLEQFEAHSQVMVLQHGFVVVHQGQLRIWGRNTKGGISNSQQELVLGTEMLYGEKFPFLMPGWGLEQAGLGEGVPAHGTLDDFGILGFFLAP